VRYIPPPCYQTRMDAMIAAYAMDVRVEPYRLTWVDVCRIWIDYRAHTQAASQ